MNRSNAIGSGTRNIPVNVATDEHRFWADLARKVNAPSVGELHRALWLAALENISPALAKELRAIRQRYYGTNLQDTLTALKTAAMESAQNIAHEAKAAGSAALLAIICFATVQSWFTHDDLQRACRRCTRRNGNRFEECITIETEEA